MSTAFAVMTRDATCAALAGELLELDRRTVVCCRPQDQAVVLGSMQPFDDAQIARAAVAGFGVTRRMSGGGAVVIEPGAVGWFDCFVPAGDPSFVRDVREGAYAIGEWWARAFVALGIEPGLLEVHRGAMTKSALAKVSCFAGLGPGEVTLSGRKIMGLSQRRTRSGAWYFSLVYLVSDPSRDAHLLAGDETEERELSRVLGDSVAVLDRTHRQLTESLLSVLEHR